MNIVLDYFFLVFHACWVIFNVFGWIWQVTRKWNLITLALTGFSWFVLGYFYGWGYCFLTDWHWKVLEIMGNAHLPSSYMQYLILRITGWEIPSWWVDRVTVLVFFLAVFFSSLTNYLDWKRKKIKK